MTQTRLKFSAEEIVPRFSQRGTFWACLFIPLGEEGTVLCCCEECGLGLVDMGPRGKWVLTAPGVPPATPGLGL